jgi:hypothetical protein
MSVPDLLTVDPEPEIELDPESAAPATVEEIDLDSDPADVPTLALMQILDADFPLPTLIRFVPDVRLKQAVDEATAYALSVKVEGADGVQRADLALTALQTSLKAIEEHFKEAAQIADDLHKRITGTRAEWLAAGKAAKATVGGRLATEQRRLDAIAAEAKRKAQAEADRAAREVARREAEAAEKARAPAPVVEELKRQAETITAPPVQTPVIAPILRGNTVVPRWKARFRGTPAEADPNPEIKNLTPAQRLQAFHLIVNVAAKLAHDLGLALEPDYLSKCPGAPLAVIAIDWSYANRRADADKSTFQIPGLEPFKQDWTRSKASRARG